MRGGDPPADDTPVSAGVYDDSLAESQLPLLPQLLSGSLCPSAGLLQPGIEDLELVSELGSLLIPEQDESLQELSVTPPIYWTTGRG